MIHGAATVFIDTLGANPSALIALDPKSMDTQRQRCLDKLSELLGCDATAVYRAQLQLTIDANKLRIGDFSIERTTNEDFETGFALHAPTTKLNAMRIIRALKVQKPILLEGSPGVGKTTLVSALARACGRPLTRINLSDQTDLMDLFGTDVPVEGAEAGHFAWRDAPFLRAMQNGEWVLLDEMNLASQSVLEGLNACLDHRGEVYISELDQVFKRHPNFRLFAAQNPHHQGGGRKGLPSSFVNRFIVVYADVFTEEDLLLIAQHNFPKVSADIVRRMINFISNLETRILVERVFGAQGSPWEFNLRDTLRWLHLLTSSDPLLSTGSVDDFLGIAIRQRFRTEKDRLEVDKLFAEIFEAPPKSHQLYHNICSSSLQVGLALMQRNQLVQPSQFPSMDIVPRLSEIESLLICIKQNIPCILVGPSGSGKSMLLQHIAASSGKSLVTFPMNADIDTMDLVGGFEQSDPIRELNTALRELQEALQLSTVSVLGEGVPDSAIDLLNALSSTKDQIEERQYLVDCIRNLQSQISAGSELATILTNARDVLQRPINISNPRFEWLDGIIVKALQKGDWLVLDNANLCSASVLDRLNSLLEPEGFLIINEHCGPNGEARVIKPHPDFRVFLTVDPRYGELSRAMRNRAIEIYIEPHTSALEVWRGRVTEVESSLKRYELLDSTSYIRSFVSSVAQNSLSFIDLPLLDKFDVHQGRTGLPRRTDLTEYYLDHTVEDMTSRHVVTGSFVESPLTVDIQKAIHHLYAALSTSVSPGLESMQPIHPLQNSVVVPLLQGHSPRLPFWLATCYDLYTDIIDAHLQLEFEEIRRASSQLSEYNWLQRSVVAGSVAAVAKDPTVKSAKFIVGVLEELDSFMRSNLSNPGSWKDRSYFFRDIMVCWWNMYRDLTAATFHGAIFQARLGMASTMLSSRISHSEDDQVRELASRILRGLDECFVSGFKLSTGLNMESLWKLLRPIPIGTESLLDNIVCMEQLASQFDLVKWQSTAAPSDLAKIMDSFVKAYQLIRLDEPNVDALLEALKVEIDQLLNNITENSASISPFMVEEFETIRQIIFLDGLSHQVEPLQESNEMILLSNIPLTTQMRVSSATDTSKLLLSMECISSENNHQQHWDGNLSARVLSKLDAVNSASLSSLASLEAELPIIARQIGTNTQAIADDRLDKLREVLWYLVSDVTAVYDSSLADAFASVREASATIDEKTIIEFDKEDLSFDVNRLLPDAAIFGQWESSRIATEHLIPAVASWVGSRYSIRRRTYLANAWVQFSIALIKLFVPDKAFDPQLRPELELGYHKGVSRFLQQKLEQLQDFEKFSTGHSTNLRCKLVEEEIAAFGPAPSAIQAVYRPRKCELPSVQAEFNNLLQIILKADISSILLQHYSGSEGATQQLHVIHENISRIGYRLKQKYRAYEDITLPVVNMIHCLELGLYLGQEATSIVPQNELPSGSLLNLAPFLGGKLENSAIQTTATHSFEFLYYSSTVVAVEGLKGLKTIEQNTFQAIHSLYDQWSQKLEADQKAEESKRSWYRYRGGLDEEVAAEQEAFDELFPTFDEENELNQMAKPKVGDARALAIKLAKVHKHIFLTPQDASESIKSLNKLLAGKASTDSNLTISDRNLLPATLLALNEKLEEIRSNTCPADYNFYTDGNLPEARRLVNLANEFRARFRQLQQVDEIGHLQPLADIVSSCDKILQIGQSDPLARTISKVEQLHAFVYEWQFGGWASKVYGALPLYNRLTDLLVGWRRLELSTWGKLFDMEVKKSEEDANSWWFIAYQAIIAVPLTLAQAGEDISQHVSSLLKELETYFSSAPIGQFASRLGLLKQLHKQLELLTEDYPSMSLIRDGLQNFISFYSRYTQAVDNSIRTGRGPLEKQMKDVLLLASWKDTNIVALRESARKSHQKLFRVVRKFRDILGRPMKPIIEGGLPDEPLDETSAVVTQTKVIHIDPHAVKLCSQYIPGWTDTYRRLANVQKTTDIMDKLSRIPESALDAGEATESFLSNLESSALELRKETPGTLTEENKALVKHLKSRKRKLFAETLKGVRQMGIHYNLSTDVLSRQNALSTVLATSDAFLSQPFKELESTDYYFHKMLDLAPKVRGASQDHSEDLTIAEVDRSIGFLEGILYASLSQRRELAKTLRQHDALATSSKYISSISTLKVGNKVTTQILSGNHERASIWLVQIIKVGIHLIEVHAKLGNVNNAEILSLLNGWLEKMNGLSANWNSLPVLPSGVTSLEKTQLENSVNSIFNEFRIELNDASHKWPALAFLLEQIRLWTIIDEHSISTDSAIKQLDVVLNATKSLCDSILVTIEQFNKKVTELPASDEEPGWLVKYGEVMVGSLKALRMKKIEKTMGELLDVLPQIDLANDNASGALRALMAVLNPIVDQYQVICKRAVEKYARVHRSTCKLGYKLSKSFTQLASQGFCTPQENSDETSGEAGQLESGTGLGEGEGAEDISKDIQPDEDLSELAQEANKEPNQEMEDEKDAVDMADQELEGDLESIDGGEDKEEDSKSGDEEESGDEMDEESGEVDDLDPSAVDEKMWDGENEEDVDKDQQGENSKGQTKKDEQVAADAPPDTQEIEPGQDEEQGDENPDENPAAEEEEDAKPQDETSMQDQNVQEQDTLALPDDMNIDGSDDDLSSISDDELDKLSDVDQEEQNDKRMDDQESENGEDAEMEMAPGDDKDEPEESAEKEDEANIQEDGQADEESENPMEEERETAELPSKDEVNADNENAAPSDVKSSGQDQDLNQTEEANNAQSNTTQQEDGEVGENAADQEAWAGKKGSVSKAQEQPSQADIDDTKDSTTSQPFKALGDALEKWHRQQREIKEAQEQESREQTKNAEQESKIQEFQHIQNDESAADAQAMGASNEEQKQQIDESMAIDDEDQPADSRILPEEEVEAGQMDEDKMDTSEPLDHQDQQETQKEERPTGVSTRQGAYNRNTTPPTNGEAPSEEVEEEIQETSTQLSITHLSEPNMELRDFDEAMQEWTSFQNKTHPLSLSLTSQLRLILTPSQSTKLSGSYRTGKRLNIKRIIPYIASSYKRDKIWMRRAIPTKRSYQILLCVDDSKSMGESSSGALALESLVMVSRALTMLEVGQIGILGFGADTFMAHEFTEPFASHDAGAKVLQKFTFDQDYTDIELLVRQTIERFRLARLQNPSRGSEDLWQLALILSDGLTPSASHEKIQLLLREAMEERIMIVFIIMDDTANSKDKQSVINLKKVRFMGNDEIKTEYYLDTFPFQYYLIVHNLEDLPGALAGLLRTWFAEVNS
ncbi:uncharacterized protein F4822DRAFT_363659 [Hypoxylon trugodes]|uniref:uncharacterized protein n=1 Tax=Hypoxylon trugodes TaxID=326681 RepID=UPI00219FC00B|nr:uncharacterized protein F4822DRAFT_363659 [Hypoxylon trugodes]KAI1384439.1 hypothetical protein F4822DRAFT_363659 [Hypoxylon trugodes]